MIRILEKPVYIPGIPSFIADADSMLHIRLSGRINDK